MSTSPSQLLTAPTQTVPATGHWRVFFTLTMPSLWLVAALVLWRHPGDEYLLFLLVNGLPGAWLPLLFGRMQGPDVLPTVIVTGLATVCVAGVLMDRLRVHKLTWLVLYAFALPVLLAWGLSQYSTYQEAIAKNGSLLTYVAAASNLSLYLATLVTVFGTIGYWAAKRLWR